MLQYQQVNNSFALLFRNIASRFAPVQHKRKAEEVRWIHFSSLPNLCGTFSLRSTLILCKRNAVDDKIQCDSFPTARVVFRLRMAV